MVGTKPVIGSTCTLDVLCHDFCSQLRLDGMLSGFKFRRMLIKKLMFGCWVLCGACAVSPENNAIEMGESAVDEDNLAIATHLTFELEGETRQLMGTMINERTMLTAAQRFLQHTPASTCLRITEAELRFLNAEHRGEDIKAENLSASVFLHPDYEGVSRLPEPDGRMFPPWDKLDLAVVVFDESPYDQNPNFENQAVAFERVALQQEPFDPFARGRNTDWFVASQPYQDSQEQGRWQIVGNPSTGFDCEREDEECILKDTKRLEAWKTADRHSFQRWNHSCRISGVCETVRWQGPIGSNSEGRENDLLEVGRPLVKLQSGDATDSTLTVVGVLTKATLVKTGWFAETRPFTEYAVVSEAAEWISSFQQQPRSCP